MIKATYAYVLCVPEHQFDEYKFWSTGSNQLAWTKAAKPYLQDVLLIVQNGQFDAGAPKKVLNGKGI